MALIDSVGGLYSAVNTKAGALTSAAKGILCIPAILTGLPGIIGSVLGELKNQVVGAMGAITDGITELITSIVTDAVNQITGAVANVLDKVLQLQATILATIGLAQATIDNFKNQIQDALDFAKNQENCRFAAAEMLKCLTGSILNDISKKVATNAKLDISGIDKVVGGLTSKISKPGNIIEQYTEKMSRSVDKATNQINTSKLL
jgi:hypothetical protein